MHNTNQPIPKVDTVSNAEKNFDKDEEAYVEAVRNSLYSNLAENKEYKSSPSSLERISQPIEPDIVIETKITNQSK